jgi:hypothetical protein
MTETFPTRLLLQLCRASPETLGAIERFLGGQPFPEWPQGAQPSPATQLVADGSSQAATEAGSRYEFRKKGDFWEVIFNGGKAFYLGATLGARYLDYLLHHPNVTITPFDLEVLVTPEKGEARSKESVQPESDPRAKRQYREALRLLQAERRHARQAWDQGRVRDLDLDIKRLNAALNKRGGMADTGERAFDNPTSRIGPRCRKSF